MKLYGLSGKKLKRKNTRQLEEKIQREIIDRVFDRDSELKVKIQVQIKEQATIDALTELSSLPKEEIESIAREVRSMHEPAPEAEDKRSAVLGISGLAGVILLAVGLPLLAVVLPAVSSHIREKKEFEADKLIRAAEKGPVETVEFLLQNGSNVNARGTRGRTALMAAVEKGDLEMARFLVSRGAKVDTKDSDGKTALFKAVDTGNVELSRLLLENGADVNTRISYTDDTPLLQAAYRNNVELMALLLDHDAKTESKRYGKDNCLEWAAMNGKAESVNFLMERGMTFKYAYDWVTDAMMLNAVKGRGESLVLVLLGKGNKYDKKKDTQRWLSAQKKLVTSALKDAARCGIGEALRPLLSSGADPNHPDADYPLLRFVDHGDMTSVKYLLDAGADINALRRGHSCETPVVKAIINQNIGMVRLLIERGADLKIEVCGYHKNALEWAYAAGGYSGTDEIYLLVRKAYDKQK